MQLRVGLILMGIGVLLISYAYIAYKKVSRNLSQLREEDIVSYYIELSLHLLPFPFWSAVIGVLLLTASLVIILVNIPLLF